MLLVQLLVLVFTGALWWIARRDLAARAAPPVLPAAPGRTADTAEMVQLCATLETLASSLARRLEAVEAAQVQGGSFRLEAAAASGPQEERPAQPEPDPRYAPVYALLAAGVSDPAEIARQTSLNRGEVDLILSLRGRRAL